MTVLFIGSDLDGQLREVETRSDLRSGWQTYIANRGKEYDGYTLANGIARHESVGEEEVARRVHFWRENDKREWQAVLDRASQAMAEGVEGVDNYIDGVVAPTIQRYMRPQLPGE